MEVLMLMTKHNSHMTASVKREEECHPGKISHDILQLTNMKSSYNNILHHQAIFYDSPRGGVSHWHNILQYLTTHQYHHQAISYDSPRGGVSQITEKGETTASFLLIQVISKKEEEEGD